MTPLKPFAFVFVALAFLFAILVPLVASAQVERGPACEAISGFVAEINETTATLELPEGGTVHVSTLCLPAGATEGVMIVRGSVSVAATRAALRDIRRLMRLASRIARPSRPIRLWQKE